VEEKWNVDIVLTEADYDTCLTLYGSGTSDAVCMTNMDSLAPSLGRDSVAVLPTSTSDGADAVIVVGIENVDELAGKPSYGLEKSVSQYMFERNLEILGKTPEQYPFKNMDPAAAAQTMQTNQENINSIVVWNPFLLQTLRTRDGSKVLFDSTTIPEEIIDMVVVGKDVLGKPGGEDFVCAVIDTFYEVNRLLSDPDKGDATLVALGAKFSSLPLEDMKKVVKQTRFYKNPAEALALYSSETFRQETMPKVVDFCVSHDIVDAKPTVGFDDASAQLNFDTSYITKVRDRQ
jgi:ABC-type nitrate/sulfonate/bicarbonate transport system substrate-binding protein